ncbi:MAG: sulfotransferase [Flavobacteriaceae bacterium]|nr:sulfotransferase [Flavobacteriaceae bacterium]|tara:strand:- start:562 stop:1461 length:900 start_codon:yes stop_codon:yes gene_type:complete
MKKPNFIIAGFPKCGTTSLHHYLDEHPEIYMPIQKELHFFTCNILSKLNKGPKDAIVKKTQINNSEKYLNFYKSVRNETAIGDASPSYINYPSQFKKIKEYLNDPKVIIILRDPIDRAYSNYLHLKREHRETLTFIESILKEDERKTNKYSDFWYYKFNSTYYDKIIKAKETFSSVLILTSEELSNNVDATLKNVYKFLEVDDTFKLKRKFKNFNKGGHFKENIFTKIIFQPSTIKNRIKKFIKPTPFLKNKISKIANIFSKKPKKMDPESLKYLKKYFKKEVEKLETLNIDTSKWRDY